MKSTLGIDIGSHNIKLIELGKDGDNKVSLLSAGSMPTPPKSLSSSLSADQESIVYVLKQLVKETGAKSTEVSIALPESQVFTRVIEVPALSQRELTSALKWEAEQYIPLPLDQVNLDFTVLRDEKTTGTGKMDVLLVAAPKTLLEKYLTIIEQADLVPVSAETEILAATRALVRGVPNLKHVMIVSLGAQSTDIAIVKSGVLLFARSIGAAGDALTRSLMESMEFSAVQSEEYKKTYGLKKDMLEGKLFAAMKPIMDTILAEIKRSIGYFDERNKGSHIEVILLSGGTAKLPGLGSYMTEHLGIETQMANPWIGITKEPRFSVLDNEGPLFSVSVGLSLR